MDYAHLFLYSVILRHVGAICAYAFGIYLARRHWDKVGLKCAAVYYVGRVVVLAALCKIGNNYPMDLPEWYRMSRWMVDGHQFPGIDFNIGYNLGFSGILAAATWIWNTPFAILFPWMFCEMGAMALFFVILRKLYGEKTAKRTIVLFLLSPVCLFSCWLGTQDEPIFLLFAALATFAILFAKHSNALTTILAFVSYSFTKIIAPLFLLPFFLMKRWSGLFASLGSVALYFALTFAVGINPLNIEVTQQGSGASVSMMTMDIQPGCVWYFLQDTPAALQNLALMVTLATIGLMLLPNFLGARKLDDREIFESAATLLGAWSITLLLLFRFNFVSYMIPFAFFASFFLSWSDEKPKWTSCTVVLWMCVVVLKDFPLTLMRQGVIGQHFCDVYSTLCLVANLALAAAFARTCHSRFTAPWTAMREIIRPMRRHP